MSEFLAALPYGATNFMKPDPNFPGARIVDTAAYERYIMTGNTSGVSGKPKHSKATPEPEQKKWGGKTKEEIIAELEADSAKYSAEEKATKEEMQRIALELGMDFVSLIGGLFTGGTTAAPVLGKLGMKLLKKYGKTVAGKMIRKLIKRFRNKKNSDQLDDIIDAIEKGGNESGVAPEPDLDLVQEPARPPSPKTPKPGEPGSKYDSKGRRRYNPDNNNRSSGKTTKYDHYQLEGDLLNEEAKLGHFEPEVMNVNLADIRKGVMPEYPKKPPAEMIDGYHEKSPLKPKPLENEPYVKITKADLIRNHRLKGKEADEMMDTINMVNAHIKAHPEDLIHAQMRYPKDDPRLAELNWKMDQMLEAGKEYMDSNFKENKKLLKRATDRTKKNIKLTDPEYVQQKYDELRGTIKSKPRINKKSPSRFFKKEKKKSSMEEINDKIKQLDKDLLI